MGETSEMRSGRVWAVARFTASTLLFGVFIAFLTAKGGSAQTSAESQAALIGNHPDAIANLRPVGHADPATRLNLEITLGLRNRTALDQLLRDQQNPVSPYYHRWLTPAQFSARFGPSQDDLDAVVQWLTALGFQVTASSLAPRSVRFSGTVSDAERAFATDIMTFGDGTSYSNITDPLIPARFSGGAQSADWTTSCIPSRFTSRHGTRK